MKKKDDEIEYDFLNLKNEVETNTKQKPTGNEELLQLDFDPAHLMKP